MVKVNRKIKLRILSFAIFIVYLLALLPGITACQGNDKDTADETGDAASGISTNESQSDGIGNGSGGNNGTSGDGGIISNTDESTDESTGKNTGESTYKGVPVFVDEKKRSYITTGYQSPVFECKVQPYTVRSDLSNIENLAQFGSFSKEQKAMLAKDGFVVTSTKEEQLFYIYEKNAYLKLPGFITTDSVLQVYHIFFDYSLRVLEAEILLAAAEQLTENMLQKSIYLYNQIMNPEVKELALLNTAYFAVAQLALEKSLPADLPAQAKTLAEEEYTNILDAEGFKKSVIVPCMLDYSQYEPRGHYTRNDDFKRYFRALMWYGQVPFSIYSTEVDGTIKLDAEGTARALMMTYNLFLDDGGGSDTDTELWERIYDPTVFYVGSADDLTIYDCKEMLVNVYGEAPDIADIGTLLEEVNAEKLKKEADKLRDPQIVPKWVTVDTPAGKQFRFMGQRYIPDSEILQELVDSFNRPMPTGMDVMGVLGSDRAYDHAINIYKAAQQWGEYPRIFNELRERFSGLPQQTWQSNMYYGWLWVLKSLICPFGEGYPSFMANTAWEDKSLNTALGSWSELRHDTILYAKQSGAEGGDGDKHPVLKGYVEPDIEAYAKLLWLTQYSRENLTARGILPEDLETRMQNFEILIQFLMTCSEKELRNEELTQEEYDTLFTYGRTLEYLTSSFAVDGTRWFEITSDADKNMAVIADVHTVPPDNYLEVGVGPASEIFVVVPINGKLYLTRGAVFSYYEFVSDKRLTDEEWQEMLRNDTQPPRPEWTDIFEKGQKQEIPVPKEPYNSGC